MREYEVMIASMFIYIYAHVYMRCECKDHGCVLMILVIEMVVDYFEYCELLYMLHQQWSFWM